MKQNATAAARIPWIESQVDDWTALVTLAIYGISQYSGVPWDDEDIRVVDFSSLSPSAKRTALRRANSARCTCGCGMNMAQCVATDSTYPIRDKNIDAIRAMVREAGSAEGGRLISDFQTSCRFKIVKT